MANTENIEAKLCAYVDGELDPAGRAEIEAHLAAHPQHRQMMVELMQQRDLLAALPRDRAPEDLFEAMTNQLERSVLLDGDAAPGAGSGAAGAGDVAGRINRWPQVFATAAVLMLAVGLAAVIYFVLPNQNRSPFALRTQPPGPAASADPSTTPSATPPARAIGVDPETRPAALAGRDPVRVEGKLGAADSVARGEPSPGMSAEAAPDTTAAAATAPTAVAAAPAPTPTAPAPTAVAAAPTPPAAAPAPPAATAAPVTTPPPAPAPVAAARSAPDVFSKSAGNEQPQSKSGELAGLTNAFADPLLNEKLSAAPDVPDNLPGRPSPRPFPCTGSASAS